MATKLYHSINPLLASSDKTSSTCYAFMVDELSHCRGKEAEQNNHSQKIMLENPAMDRKLERRKIESIGKTMQMHEAIFKHQVSELHRLYKVQRVLMDEAKKHIQAHQAHIQAHQAQNGRIIGIGFDLERPVEEDIIVSATANRSNNNNQMNTGDGSGEELDSDVELTLSIGGSSSGKHKRHRNSKPRIQSHSLELDSWGNSSKSDQREDCRSGPNTPMSSSSATLEHHHPQEAIKRPHWLFQR